MKSSGSNFFEDRVGFIIDDKREIRRSLTKRLLFSFARRIL